MTDNMAAFQRMLRALLRRSSPPRFPDLDGVAVWSVLQVRIGVPAAAATGANPVKPSFMRSR